MMFFSILFFVFLHSPPSQWFGPGLSAVANDFDLTLEITRLLWFVEHFWFYFFLNWDAIYFKQSNFWNAHSNEGAPSQIETCPFAACHFKCGQRGSVLKQFTRLRLDNTSCASVAICPPLVPKDSWYKFSITRNLELDKKQNMDGCVHVENFHFALKEQNILSGGRENLSLEWE